MTLCYVEPNCVSYNFKKTKTNNEDHKCELNNSTHEGHENELKGDRSYNYHGAEVRNLDFKSFSLLDNPAQFPSRGRGVGASLGNFGGLWEAHLTRGVPLPAPLCHLPQPQPHMDSVFKRI